jgi:hypothetical protein
MITIVLLLIIGALGCAEYCPLGDPCERSCPVGTSGVCGPSDLCLCGANEPNIIELDPTCRPPRFGDLRITEVLIDGEPTEDSEFVEMVNTSDEDVALAGVAILSTRGNKLVKRVLFLSGCIRGRTAVAMYGAETEWIWSSPPVRTPALDLGAFGFSNSADFRFVIESPSGEKLDLVSGDSSQIRSGISLTRDFDDQREHLSLHNLLGAGRRDSPALCPNGARHEDQCRSVDLNRCRTISEGQIRINEVLIDGIESEEEEFIELVNATDHHLSLAGLQIMSNRGRGVAQRVQFFSGCMPPRGAVALFAQQERWRWHPKPTEDVEFGIQRFGFPNDADFEFRLQNYQGVVIDTFAGSSQLIRPGESINRWPDVYGDDLTFHAEHSELLSSAGVCLNGLSFQRGCLEESGPTKEQVKMLLEGLPWTTLMKPD